MSARPVGADGSGGPAPALGVGMSGSAGAVRIRPARAADAPRAAEIEIAGGRAFAEIGTVEVAADVPDESGLIRTAEEGRLWVLEAWTPAAQEGRGQGGEGTRWETAGYAAAEILDGCAHIAQVTVDPVHAGHGYGAALIAHVEQWGRVHGCRATTLTTFRSVPWNAPYYARLGFEVMGPEEIGPELTRTMDHEATSPGLDAALRCAMIRR